LPKLNSMLEQRIEWACQNHDEPKRILFLPGRCSAESGISQN
jgi:hypothetical protein